MTSLHSVILTLAIAYAVIGALLLVILVYARLRWPAKAVLVAVTSAFYVASFFAVRGLLGWASFERPPPSFKLLQVRIVEPHTLQSSDRGAIYLWVEALDDDNLPSGVPRAYRLPYSEALARKSDRAAQELAAGHPQGGRAADLGTGEGGLIAAAREYITPSVVLETTGGDPSLGAELATPGPNDGLAFTPLLPPRPPPKETESAE